MVAFDRSTGDDTQRWAHPLLLVTERRRARRMRPTRTATACTRQTGTSPRWLSPLATTIIFTVYAVAALGAVLVPGRISDVVGRKPVLIAAPAATLIGLGVFLVADNMALLLLARAIHGGAVGSIVVAGAAALLDLRPPPEDSSPERCTVPARTSSISAARSSGANRRSTSRLLGADRACGRRSPDGADPLGRLPPAPCRRGRRPRRHDAGADPAGRHRRCSTASAAAVAPRRPVALAAQRGRGYAGGSGIPRSAMTVRSRVG